MRLNEWMNGGIGRILRTAGRFYLGNPSGRRFLAEYLPRMRKSALLREQNEGEGTHVPPFLIASIAAGCNLRCAGCYARAEGACGEAGGEELSAGAWSAIFREAAGLGVSFLLLAGGEPFTRRDVLERAAQTPELLFPIFTNGTLLDGEALALLDRHRNLIPVLSLEGGRAETDARRGHGTYDKLERAMDALESRGIFFGVSVTVTRRNLEQVTAPGLLSGLRKRGCGAAVLVEYVPAEPGTEVLALEDGERARLAEAAAGLKRSFADMVILSFPGDEAAMGGCLAAGRGFFHINARGGAEPCPFSPYSLDRMGETSMREVLRSGYFAKVRGLEEGPQQGGCALFARRAEVQALLAGAGKDSL